MNPEEEVQLFLKIYGQLAPRYDPRLRTFNPMPWDELPAISKLLLTECFKELRQQRELRERYPEQYK